VKMMEYPFEEYKDLLRQKLKESRYLHSLAVMERAVFLAKRWGADPEKARIAGLLHDVMKNTDPKNQLIFLREFGIILKQEEKAAFPIWHSFSGALYVEKVLGIADKEIIDSIRYHTTGRADMTLLDKVIFMADLTSSDRNYPDAAFVRELSEEDLDASLLYGIEFVIGDLLRNGKVLHPDTVGCYNRLVQQGVKRIWLEK